MNRFGSQLLLSAVRNLASKNCTSSKLVNSSVRLYSIKCSRASFKHCLLQESSSPAFSGNRAFLLQKRFQSSQQTSANELEDAESAEPEEAQQQQQNPVPSDEEVAQFYQKHQIHVAGLKDPNIQKPIFHFSHLNMPEHLQKLMAKFKYETPTPIQAQSLPILFSDRDLIGIAQTGSGKTLAYLLPAFAKYFESRREYYPAKNQAFTQRHPKVLILAPTRELAQQIYDVVAQFRTFTCIACYGGKDRNVQMRYLETNNPQIVIGTPGRLKDLVDSQIINLAEVDYLVVDEADRMLDMGFEPQIEYLIKRCNKQRQTMMFSATWPNEVKHLVHKYLRDNHAFLSIGGTELVANHNIKQVVEVCSLYERNERLIEILDRHSNEKVMIFSNMKSTCDRVARMIQAKCRTRSAAIHGDLSQRQRENTIDDFKAGSIKVLCATNVAARGLDIDDVSVVINYDMPEDAETYVHRIGRTGRKNNKGFSYTFFTDNSKGGLARELIRVMEEAEQEVSEELQEVAARGGHIPNVKRDYSGNRRRDPFEMGRSGGGFQSRGGSRFGGGPRRYNNDFNDNDSGEVEYERRPSRSGGGYDRGGFSNNRFQGGGQRNQRSSRGYEDDDY